MIVHRRPRKRLPRLTDPARRAALALVLALLLAGVLVAAARWA